MRDVLRMAKDGKELISSGRDMTGRELFTLMDIANDTNRNAIVSAIDTAFYFGIRVGYMQAKADEKERRTRKND